ncbi:MAG TPA: DUF4105 domain-containing protein [Flavisolibacter sp.]|nr:DUF4105 domain-containing protein [Flavisolibacter sp.]
MKKILFIAALLLNCFNQAQAQKDSCSLQVSLLTCAPGEELYSTFGHTALRVKDPSNGSDLVFNYGSFEYGPDFYMQFVRGKLLYYVSVDDFNAFLYQYQLESRSVQEQIIQLGCVEKQRLLQALLENARPENRYYRYDFLFDNCTTRAGDMVIGQAADSVVFENILPERPLSFRNLIHSYLDAGNQYWSKLGIDILLGMKLDRAVTNREAMFLPDYLLKGFDNATIGGKPLASPPQMILDQPSALQDTSWITPGASFSLLLVLIVALSFLRTDMALRAMRVFDHVFFFVLGLAGLLLLFMWFATDHTVCSNNLNLLWAFPGHLIAAFFAYSQKKWIRNYFRFSFWMSLMLAVTWFFLPQQLNTALLPIVMVIALRSWFLSKKSSYGKKNTVL